MTGENEWTKSTNDQVAMPTTLINSLVPYLAWSEQLIRPQDGIFPILLRCSRGLLRDLSSGDEIFCHGHHTGYSCKGREVSLELVTLLWIMPTSIVVQKGQLR